MKIRRNDDGRFIEIENDYGDYVVDVDLAAVTHMEVDIQGMFHLHIESGLTVECGVELVDREYLRKMWRNARHVYATSSDNIGVSIG